MAALWKALSASARGATHVRNGVPNQDAVRLQAPAVAADPLFLAVADGHGSPRSFRSARGSVLATECALRLLRDFVRKLGPYAPLSAVRRRMENNWPALLLSEWHRAVREDLARNPFTAMDFAAYPEKPPVIKPGVDLPFSAYLAYGTTLVFAAVTRRYLVYGQLGDGDIQIVRGDGKVTRPWPLDHRFFSSETISLCSHNAVVRFKARVEPLRGTAPALIMLSTDGYANCFENDAKFSRVGADFLTYLRESGPAFVGANLEEWLRDSSRDGSGDDITVGLAVRVAALRGAPSAQSGAAVSRS
jgi:serine/threonine protein phosphatase PrpC